MANAYKCDLCGKLAEDCYKISGIDMYSTDFKEMGIDKSAKYEIRDCCEECHEKIKKVAREIFKNSRKSEEKR